MLFKHANVREIYDNIVQAFWLIIMLFWMPILTGLYFLIQNIFE